MLRGGVATHYEDYNPRDRSHYLITAAHLKLFADQEKLLPDDSFEESLEKRVAQIRKRSEAEFLRLLREVDTAKSLGGNLLANSKYLDLKKELKAAREFAEWVEHNQERLYGIAVTQENNELAKSQKLVAMLKEVAGKKLFAAPGVDVGSSVRRRILQAAEKLDASGRLSDPVEHRLDYSDYNKARAVLKEMVADYYRTFDKALVASIQRKITAASNEIENIEAMLKSGRTNKGRLLLESEKYYLRMEAAAYGEERKKAGNELLRYFKSTMPEELKFILGEFDKKYSKLRTQRDALHEERLVFLSGKYKGQRIYGESVPIQYLMWIADGARLGSWRFEQVGKYGKDFANITFERDQKGRVRPVVVSVTLTQKLSSGKRVQHHVRITEGMEGWDNVVRDLKYDKKKAQGRNNHKDYEVDTGSVNFGTPLVREVKRYLRSPEGKKRVRAYEAELENRDKEQTRGFSPVEALSELDRRRKGAPGKKDPADVAYNSERSGSHPAFSELEVQSRLAQEKELDEDKELSSKYNLARHLSSMPNSKLRELVRQAPDDVADRKDRRALLAVYREAGVHLAEHQYRQRPGHEVEESLSEAAYKTIAKYDPSWHPHQPEWFGVVGPMASARNPGLSQQELMTQGMTGWFLAYGDIEERVENVRIRAAARREGKKQGGISGQELEWSYEEFAFEVQSIRKDIERLLDPRYSAVEEVRRFVEQNPDYFVVYLTEELLLKLYENTQSALFEHGLEARTKDKRLGIHEYSMENEESLDDYVDQESELPREAPPLNKPFLEQEGNEDAAVQSYGEKFNVLMESDRPGERNPLGQDVGFPSETKEPSYSESLEELAERIKKNGGRSTPPDQI